MEPQKVHIALLDGRELDFETTTMFCTADRVRWEQTFGVHPGAMAQGDLTEEHLLWFAWRAGCRADETLRALSFDEFIDAANTWEIVSERDEEVAADADPTLDGARPG